MERAPIGVVCCARVADGFFAIVLFLFAFGREGEIEKQRKVTRDPFTLALNAHSWNENSVKDLAHPGDPFREQTNKNE